MESTSKMEQKILKKRVKNKLVKGYKALKLHKTRGKNCTFSIKYNKHILIWTSSLLRSVILWDKFILCAHIFLFSSI